jgi:epsilon-lactone hydrolase
VASEAHEAMVARLVAERAAAATPSGFPSVEMIVSTRADEVSEVVAPEGSSVEEVDADGVRAYWVIPDGEVGPATIVYFHGGGYIWLTAAAVLPVMAALAQSANARVLGVDYRRAPEHRFPAPVTDAVTAYRWLLRQGMSSSSIVFAGDSAGGGLVIAAMVALRDTGTELPAAGAPVSPWTDLAITGTSTRIADDPIVSRSLLEFMADVYLGGAAPDEPTASPLYANLVGLPPLLVQVGTREALLDDARRFVDKARGAGVDVTLVEHQGVVHMWIVFDPTIPESQAAYRGIADFVAAHVATPASTASE